MDKTYDLNDVAMMTGFTTRTLRNYLTQGLLKGEKVNGAWQFTAGDLDAFFSEPFVKEGLRIKRSGVVFDFLADRKKQTARTCVVLDIPASLKKGGAISSFFCARMNEAEDVDFTYDMDKGTCRVILSGAAEQVAGIMQAYFAAQLGDGSVFE